ncbi:membrane protein [Streptomyces sp. PRh5]|nr:membrane protein [Streptomyces sp. PRh5]
MVTGCGSSGSDPSGDSRDSGHSRNAPASTRAPHGPTPRATPRATSPVRLCADLISYWAEQDLADSQWAGLDWEQKGLSNQQYEIYDDIVQDARAERRRHGTPAAKALIKRLAERRCAAANGATHSSENWRPPT